MQTALLLGGALLAAAVDAVDPLPNQSHPDCKNGPLAGNKVCDPSADPVTRAKALLSALTIQEKLNLTGNVTPGVARVGLPPYGWWQEALHGVASSPGTTFADDGDFSYATSFPQPILMGAAFDNDLIHSIATIISTEARAFNNANRTGLDFWTPNINGFKDPRWGRGQETPGEDSFHLSSYVGSLIDGLQGSPDDKYKRVVATCKHFAGYDVESWNGNWRFLFDAQISMQDLSEYYMPAFKACVKANVGAFMCSYNSVNGVPACSNEYLMQDILRDHWGWTGDDQWVVSDCDAVEMVYLPHEFKPTRAEAVAASLKSGCDLNCGAYYQLYLPDAYKKGLITEDDLDKALVRLYASLVRVGYFDAPEVQPYRSLGWKDVNTPEAQQLAYQAAVEGITLLKNDGTLPIDLQGKTVAVVGDWANATTQMQGNYQGIAPYLISPLMAAQKITTVNYSGGPGHSDPTTGAWFDILSICQQSDIIIYVSGVDDSTESEGMDRDSVSWTQTQLDIIDQIAEYGKPTILVQMGGGQVDNTPFKKNANINAILWGGYPGQSGGDAIIDIITGKAAPAGRLPVTQYPANYIAQVPASEMSLRPGPRSPGRTYKWYTGEAVYPFGYGLHYTNFSVSVSSNSSVKSAFESQGGSTFAIPSLVNGCQSKKPAPKFIEDCPFGTLYVDVENTGDVASDYVALLFLGGEFGPKPYPAKSLVSYQRAHNIAPSQKQTVALDLTLGSFARVDEQGNSVVYPGDYTLLLDVDSKLSVNFKLTGKEAMIDKWPQPKPESADPPTWVSDDYWSAGYGSEGVITSNSTS
ncbi:putative xylan 1,4-beta-Xylosidase [Xylaria intraflava]|nr:putative xylan 1,4-beta-Xylosidase [Xylaria intraflava]